MSNDLSYAKTLVTSNTDFIDECIIICAVRDYKFWYTYCRDAVNARFKYKGGYEDFNRPVYNLIYEIVNEYYSGFGEKAGNMSLEIVLNLADERRRKGLISDQDMSAVIETVTGFWAVDLSTFQTFAHACFHLWLDRKRTLQLVSGVAGGKWQMAEDVINQLQGVRRISHKATANRAPTALEAVSAAHEVTVPGISYPLPSLGEFSIPLGGGLIPGEMGLIITPPNGGKTVLANQITVDIALSRRNVVLVTTEQSASQMYWRQYSNVARIDFKKLALGYEPKTLNERENAKILKYATRVDPYLRISDWSQNPDTIEGGIEPLVENYIEEGWKPDVLVFDWLGGGMDITEEDQKTQDHMIRVTKTLRDICSKKYGISVVLFAQASESQTENVVRVRAVHAYNCKMLHTFADWGLGISLLRAKGPAQTEMEGEDILPQQWFNFFKSRNAPGSCFKFEREFQYQRFRPVSASVFQKDPLAD